MRCRKCHVTMNKDSYFHTATCPCCGRTVSYKTKSEKKARRNSVGDAELPVVLGFILPFIIGAISYSVAQTDYDDFAPWNIEDKKKNVFVKWIAIIGIAALLGTILLLIVLKVVKGDDFWPFFKNVLYILAHSLWTVLKWIFKCIWNGISRLFSLIFHK